MNKRNHKKLRNVMINGKNNLNINVIYVQIYKHFQTINYILNIIWII